MEDGDGRTTRIVAPTPDGGGAEFLELNHDSLDLHKGGATTFLAVWHIPAQGLEFSDWGVGGGGWRGSCKRLAKGDMKRKVRRGGGEGKRKTGRGGGPRRRWRTGRVRDTLPRGGKG